ncbi:hypothetical protein [Agreia sp. VKM Ac-1783]|uniref:hypothetical protein n=1 Tax=Agreia sp. VKM Ac-1783 TaxID=1938889 RepID=UPI000A2ADFC5|nr:hypothetical protein [Agreia sp. VKM Ac-1783]SMQ71888.1 hypothetical protein SAMN06295943_2775 [Agreia sp. VKM Ac-1783]
MAHEIVSLLGGTTTSSGHQLSGGIARQTKREVDTVAARTEVAHVTDQARAFLTASAANNIITLYGMAEQGLQSAPAAASDVLEVLHAYSRGAAFQIATFK